MTPHSMQLLTGVNTTVSNLSLPPTSSSYTNFFGRQNFFGKFYDFLTVQYMFNIIPINFCIETIYFEGQNVLVK